ncbi:hypothetical protein D3C85_1716190 [compost metagenome]
MLNLLDAVFKDFGLGRIFNLCDKAFHVDNDFPGIGLTDRFQDQRQCGFKAGNFCRQHFRVCRRSEVNVAHFLS